MTTTMQVPTTQYELVDVKNESLRRAIEKNVFGPDMSFRVRVLADAVPTSTEAVRMLVQAPGDSERADSAPLNYIFNGRILDSDKGRPSPHVFYQNPCDLSTAPIAARGRTAQFLGLHTQFIVKTSVLSVPTEGSTVVVSLQKGTPYQFDLQFAFADAPVMESIGPGNIEQIMECQSLSELDWENLSSVNSFVAPTAGIVGGPSTVADINAAYSAVAAVPGFAEKIVQVANNVGIPDPGWLANLINFESGFDETKQNDRGSDCWGLIQFCRTSGAEEVGVIWKAGERPPDYFLNNGPIAQMKYVEKYFLKAKGKYKTIQDVYARVFFPISMNYGDDFNIYDWYVKNKPTYASTYRRQNPGITYKGDYTTLANKNAKLPTVLPSTTT